MWHLQKIAITAHLSKIYMIIPYNAMVISLNTSFSEKKDKIISSKIPSMK